MDEYNIWMDRRAERMVLKGPYVPNIRRVIVPTGGPRRGKARSIWIYSGVSSTTLLYRRVSLFGPRSVDAPELRRCRGYKIGRLWKRINPWGARGGGHAGPSFISFSAFYGKYSRIDRVGRTSGNKNRGLLTTVPRILVGFRVNRFD